VNPVVVARSVDSVEAYIAQRAASAAKQTYGYPFAASTRRFAFVACDGVDGPQTGALLMTVAGGVATLDGLELEPARQAGVAASALLARFEETASYNNCHKAWARVKRGGETDVLLSGAGYRCAGIVERHYFQFDFVDMVKWLA
jgi:hypothetical protein